MKRKPKKTLSPLQEKKLLRFILFLAAAAILWLMFAPDMGIYSVYKKRSRLHELRSEIKELEKQNDALNNDIERIQTDIEYLEQIARDKHGLLKENEMVFDFSSRKKEKK